MLPESGVSGDSECVVVWEVFSAACKTALKMNRQLLESHALGPRGQSGGRGLAKAIVETWLLFFVGGFGRC